MTNCSIFISEGNCQKMKETSKLIVRHLIRKRVTMTFENFSYQLLKSAETLTSNTKTTFNLPLLIPQAQFLSQYYNIEDIICSVFTQLRFLDTELSLGMDTFKRKMIKQYIQHLLYHNLLYYNSFNNTLPPLIADPPLLDETNKSTNILTDPSELFKKLQIGYSFREDMGNNISM